VVASAMAMVVVALAGLETEKEGKVLEKGVVVWAKEELVGLVHL